MANSPNAIAGTYLVGAPGVGVRSTAATFVGSYSQPPTANSLLVAVLMGGGTTGTATNFSQFTGTTGWTQVLTKGNYTNTTCHSRVEVWTKTAAGNDAAPTFSNPFTGTIAAQCVIYELSNPNATPVDVSNTYGSGTASGSITSASLSLATSGNVAGTGEFAISAYATEIPGGAATNTWAKGSAFSNNGYNDASTSSFVHTATDWKAGPASGSTLTDAPTITTFTGYAAGLIVVFKQATGRYYPYGSISAVGMLASGNSSGATTLAVSPQFVGDALVFVSKVSSGTLTVSSIAGSGTTGWTKVAGTFVDTESGNVRSHEIWLGKVTAAGATTLTVTWSSSNSGLATDYDCMEFTNGYGSTAASTSSWARDGTQQANQNNVSGTTINWANITATAAGELWVGMNREVGGTYYWAADNYSVSCLDSNSNVYMYNTNTGSGSITVYATQPVATTSHTLDVLITSSYGVIVTTTALNGSVSFPAPQMNISQGIITTVLNGSVSFPALAVNVGQVITTTVLNGTVSFPAITPHMGSGITTTVLSGSVSFPTTTMNTSSIITSAVLNSSAVFPTVAMHTSTNLTSTVLATSATFPAPTPNAGSGITTSVLNGTVSFPAPTPHAGSVITTSVLNGTVSFPSPVTNAGSVITTSVLAVSATFPAPTPNAGSGITTVVLAALATFPAPTVSTTGGTTNITTTVLLGSVSFPSPTLNTDTNLISAVLSGSVSFPSPTMRTDSNLTSTVLAVSATFPLPTPHTGSVITTTALATSATFPIPVTNTGSVITTSVLNGTVSFPAPTPNAGSVITTSVLNGTVSFPSPSLSAGSVITTTVLNTSATFPAPTVTAGGNATITTIVLGCSVAFPSPVVNAGSVITTSVLATSATFTAPTVNAGSGITTTVLNGSAVFPASTVNAGVGITPTVLSVLTTFPGVTVNAGSGITTTVLATAAIFPLPTVNAGVGIIPPTLIVGATFPAPSVQSGTGVLDANITTTVLSCSVVFPALYHVGAVMVPIPDSGIGGTAIGKPISGVVGTPNISGTVSTQIIGGTAIAAKSPITGTASGTFVEGIANIANLPVGGTAVTKTATSIGTAGIGNDAFTGTAIPKINAQGVATYASYGGSENSRTMAIMINLSGYENNDSTFYLQALNNGYPLPLTGYTNQLVVKPSPSVADNTGTTYTVGSGLTVTNSSQGMVTFVLPHTAATTAGTSWWRWDITDGGGNVTTVMFGNLYILPV